MGHKVFRLEFGLRALFVKIFLGRVHLSVLDG